MFSKLEVSYESDLPTSAQSLEVGSNQNFVYARSSTAVGSAEVDAKREFHDVGFGIQEVDLSATMGSGNAESSSRPASGGDGSGGGELASTSGALDASGTYSAPDVTIGTTEDGQATDTGSTGSDCNKSRAEQSGKSCKCRSQRMIKQRLVK